MNTLCLWVFKVKQACTVRQQVLTSVNRFVLNILQFLLLLPLIVSSRQWWAQGRLITNFVLLLQHAVGEGDEVALQDHEALPQTLGRQGTFGHQT